MRGGCDVCEGLMMGLRVIQTPSDARLSRDAR
jgi:hypothetical protein